LTHTLGRGGTKELFMEVFIMNMQYDWNKPDTIRTFVEEIQTRAIEDYDKFIFETIKPYCEHITQQTISKEYLENALLHYRDLEQENEKLKKENEELKSQLSWEEF
jgi:cell shape-determining protein MreC